MKDFNDWWMNYPDELPSVEYDIAKHGWDAGKMYGLKLAADIFLGKIKYDFVAADGYANADNIASELIVMADKLK